MGHTGRRRKGVFGAYRWKGFFEACKWKKEGFLGHAAGGRKVSVSLFRGLIIASIPKLYFM